MCEYTQREYRCGHTKFIAARWCRDYIRTHRRCQPDVQNYEYRHDAVCGACQPQQPPPWEAMIRRTPNPATGPK